jgi:hypothetical protein
MNKFSLENKIKLISVIIALLVAITGIIQYTSTRNENFRKAFWEKRYELYNKVIETASDIANSKGLRESEDLRRDFWKYYWGNLSLIEDKTMEGAMVNFGTLLSECETGEKTGKKCFYDSDTNTTKANDYVGLRQRSHTLAQCAKESLRKTWDPVSLTKNKCPYKKETSIEKFRRLSLKPFNPTYI